MTPLALAALAALAAALLAVWLAYLGTTFPDNGVHHCCSKCYVA